MPFLILTDGISTNFNISSTTKGVAPDIQKAVQRV